MHRELMEKQHQQTTLVRAKLSQLAAAIAAGSTTATVPSPAYFYWSWARLTTSRHTSNSLREQRFPRRNVRFWLDGTDPTESLRRWGKWIKGFNSRDVVIYPSYITLKRWHARKALHTLFPKILKYLLQETNLRRCHWESNWAQPRDKICRSKWAATKTCSPYTFIPATIYCIYIVYGPKQAV